VRIALAVVATIALAGPARADGPEVAVGLEVGEPTSATAALFTGKLVVAAALGSGTLEGFGVSAHLDVQLAVTELAPRIPLRVGLGGRFYHHGYTPMSIDEIPDNHFGARASVSVALERKAFELYAEAAPGIDVKRTRSCTFVDGADSICPHAQQLPVFLQFAVGVRWFLSH
jgi:hypothetical protein